LRGRCGSAIYFALLVAPFSPPKEALELLNRLAEDWKNEVW
jgi:hypothetical protein